MGPKRSRAGASSDHGSPTSDAALEPPSKRSKEGDAGKPSSGVPSSVPGNTGADGEIDEEWDPALQEPGAEDDVDREWEPTTEDPHVSAGEEEDVPDDVVNISNKAVGVDREWTMLNGETFKHWTVKAQEFCDQIIHVDFDRVMRLCVMDKTVQYYLNELNSGLDGLDRGNTRSNATAKAVIPEVMQRTGSFLSATPHQKEGWTALEHWCQFIARLHAYTVQDSGGILKNKRELRDEGTAFTCVWVLGHIITKKNKGEIKQKTINGIEKREKVGNIHAQAIKIAGGTIGVPEGADKFKRTRDMLMQKAGLKRVGPRKASSGPPLRVRTAKPPKRVAQGNKKGKQRADATIETLDDEAVVDTVTDALETELYDEYNEAQHRDLQKGVDASLTEARKARAARSLAQMMASLNRRPLARKQYAQIISILFKSAVNLKRDWRHVDKADVASIVDPVMSHIQKALESGGGLATGSNDARTLADDEVSKLIQAEDVQTFNETNGEDITPEFSASLMVLKQVTKEEIAASLKWDQDQSSELFSSTALKDAMLALRILDRVKKLLPNSTIPLRWWQVIAVAWLWALMYGGLLADTMGLGKTITSCALLVHCSNEFHASYAECQINGTDLPKALPNMVITLPALVFQTAREYAKFSTKLRIIVLGKGSGFRHERFKCVDSISSTDDFWNQDNPANADVVFIASINWYCDKFGPSAFWNWASQHRTEYFEAYPQFGPKTFNQIRQAPGAAPIERPNFPQSWIHGKINILIIDECQLMVRNVNNFWKALNWMEAKKTILLSGYPAPRGMSDFVPYLRLINPPELVQRFHDFEKTHNIWDPYDMPNDNHAMAPFRMVWTVFEQFIVDAPKLNDIERARKAQATLATFVLRRDYSSALPHGSNNTIGRSMPEKRHFTINCVFTPSQERAYYRYSGKWTPRLMTLREGHDGSTKATPNSRATRAIELIEFFPPCGALHKVVSVPKRPNRLRPGVPGWDNEVYNRDQLSWFYKDSPISKDYSKLIDRIRTTKERGGRIRWLLKKAHAARCVEFRDGVYDFDHMTDIELVRTFCQWSPKMVAVLGFVADFTLVRQEKVIIWVMTPEIQDLIAEILELLNIPMYIVNTDTKARARDAIQSAWNDHDSQRTKVLLAAGRVCGTGFNLQGDSRAAIVVDTPDTEQQECQLLSRQHRGGQTMTVLFFMLSVGNCRSEKRLESNLLQSLAATAAFSSYDMRPFDVDPGVPLAHVELFRDNWLAGFIRRPIDPNGSESDHSNYRYMHVLSTEGQQEVRKLREEKGESDDWYPTLLPFDFVLQGISTQQKTKRASQICGITVDTDLYDAIKKEELDERTIERIEDAGYDTDAPEVKSKKGKNKQPQSTEPSPAKPSPAKRPRKEYGPVSVRDAAVRELEARCEETDEEKEGGPPGHRFSLPVPSASTSSQLTSQPGPSASTSSQLTSQPGPSGFRSFQSTSRPVPSDRRTSSLFPTLSDTDDNHPIRAALRQKPWAKLPAAPQSGQRRSLISLAAGANPPEQVDTDDYADVCEIDVVDAHWEAYVAQEKEANPENPNISSEGFDRYMERVEKSPNPPRDSTLDGPKEYTDEGLLAHLRGLEAKADAAFNESARALTSEYHPAPRDFDEEMPDDLNTPDPEEIPFTGESTFEEVTEALKDGTRNLTHDEWSQFDQKLKKKVSRHMKKVIPGWVVPRASPKRKDKSTS